MKTSKIVLKALVATARCRCQRDLIQVCKAIVFIGLSFCLTPDVNAQGVGINPSGNDPHSSAGLDVDFTNRGMLIPRVSLSSTTDASTIPSPATYLTVFNTNASMTNGNGAGMYYWSGSNWLYMTSSSGPGISGQVLTSGGEGTSATWTTPSAATCPTAGSGETLIKFNGCLYVKNVDQSGTYTWANALNTCTGLGSGWYLPNRMELDVLFQNWNNNGAQCQGGTCPLSGFNSGNYYWSSSVATSTLALVIHFGSATLTDQSKTTSSNTNVRCVRR